MAQKVFGWSIQCLARPDDILIRAHQNKRGLISLTPVGSRIAQNIEGNLEFCRRIRQSFDRRFIGIESNERKALPQSIKRQLTI